MKKYSIILIPIIICSCILISNSDVSSPQAMNIARQDEVSEQINTETDVILETPKDIIKEDIVEFVEPPAVEETQEELNARYSDIMLYSFILCDGYDNFIPKYTFINDTLKMKYPDKFNSDNLQSTIDYLVNYFSGATRRDFQEKANNFTW